MATTPSKNSKVVEVFNAPALPILPEEEPTPAHIRCALGPTPQKDGAVLGIFDMLSAGTPSKANANSTLVLSTPSKATTMPTLDAKPSDTPQSSSKRFYMDAFAGTPLKRKRENGDFTPNTNKKLFATPSFLRRNWPLARIDEDTHERPTTGQPFKKRGLVRSLSSIIHGLKKQEEKRMDDDWDILNEIEEEEAGEAEGESQRPIAPKLLVEDSQAIDMPLGPDKGIESSGEESDVDPGALDANGQPRKVWKKKGLKRQTRRVIMRPVTHKAKEGGKDSALNGEEIDAEVVQETQFVDKPTTARKRGTVDEASDFEDNSDADEAHDSQQSRHEKIRKARAPVAMESMDVTTEKRSKKVQPQAHANYRALKIKNKNSKGKGKGGRFGRR